MALRKRIERIDRDELYKRWDSRDGFDELMGQADDNNWSVGQQMEAQSPTNPKEHKYQAVEDVLWRRGYDVYDDEDTQVIASPMNAFGKWNENNDKSVTDEANDRLLLDEHLSKSYSRTLSTGVKTKNLLLVKSIQSIGGMETGTSLNPIYDAPFIRAKLFGPAIDYRRIVGNITRIREEVYRLSKFNNDESERKMDRMAEATTPRMMELDYSDQSLQFELFRKGIEASYDYLNSSQTRVSMIRNAIEEVAEQHRIAIFEMIVTKIRGALLSTHDYVTTGQPGAQGHVAGSLTFNRWIRFRKTFGPMYSPDIVLGTSESITDFELMYAQFGAGAAANTNSIDRDNIPIGNLAGFTGGLVRNPQLLNNVPNVPEYGWYDDLPNTVLANDELLVFDRDRSSNLVFQIGSDQDETKREPGPRVVQRFLATKAGVEIPDANGIRVLQLG